MGFEPLLDQSISCSLRGGKVSPTHSSTIIKWRRRWESNPLASARQAAALSKERLRQIGGHVMHITRILSICYERDTPNAHNLRGCFTIKLPASTCDMAIGWELNPHTSSNLVDRKGIEPFLPRCKRRVVPIRQPKLFCCIVGFVGLLSYNFTTLYISRALSTLSATLHLCSPLGYRVLLLCDSNGCVIYHTRTTNIWWGMLVTIQPGVEQLLYRQSRILNGLIPQIIVSTHWSAYGEIYWYMPLGGAACLWLLPHSDTNQYILPSVFY